MSWAFALLFVVVGISQVTREQKVSDCEAELANEGEQQATSIGDLITLRVCLGGLCAFSVYFTAGFLDAVLPQQLMVRLAITVGVMSLCFSFRSFSYLAGSFVVAQLVHRRPVSFEVAVFCGLLGRPSGILLLGPQRVVADVELMLAGTASMSLLL